MLDEEEPADGGRLFLNVSTGRFRHRQVPALRDHILVGASDGLLVIGDRKKPLHAVRLLNPFTGSLLRFAVTMPSYRTKAVVGGGHGHAPSLVFWLEYLEDDVIWGADPSSPHVRITFGPTPVWLASMVAYAGRVYMVDWAATVYEIVWDGCFTYRLGIVQRLDAFVSSEDSDECDWHTNFLVESDGDLLLVRRPRLRSQAMEVFRVDVEQRSREPVKRIAGALFLGERCLSVDAEKLPSVDGNCVYYGTPDIFSSGYRLQKCEGIYRYDLNGGGEERISGLLVPGSDSFCARHFSLVQVLVTYCAVLPDVEAQVVKDKK